jgi:transcriptional regulator with XRE-family HTH domain
VAQRGKPSPRARSGADRTAVALIESTQSLGERLREERDRKGLTLRELARRIEVSPSLVSQIETGKIRPSVRTLYAMLDEYDVTVEQLFAGSGSTVVVDGFDASSRPAGAAAPADRPLAPARRKRRRSAEDRVQRADSRRVIELESGVRWERLTTTGDDDVDVDFHATVYDVGGASSPEGQLVRHQGREFGYVLSGRLGITVGSEAYVLEAGDSISFDSTLPHRLHNDGDEPLSAIWFVLGR